MRIPLRSNVEIIISEINLENKSLKKNVCFSCRLNISSVIVWVSSESIFFSANLKIQKIIKSFGSPVWTLLILKLKEVFVMFFRPSKLSAKSLFVLLLISAFALFTFETQAQTKKNSKETAKKITPAKQTNSKTTAKKVDDKKTTASSKDKSKTNDKTSKTTDKNSKTADKNSKSSKPSKAELAKQAEQKRIEAERQAAARKAEEARRQAALAEKRRREQAAREARERQLAFERGLKTETQQNIANDDTEGEDLEVRKAAINALGNRAGTVVVMEPQTGKVLSIVNQEWGIRRSFKPCSTIKLVTGVAGVNEKVIDQSGNIKSRKFPLNLDDALAHSNNSYFQVAGQNIGNERIISYAKALIILVPRAGVEPARCYHRGILSPLRLPIPPPRHR